MIVVVCEDQDAVSIEKAMIRVDDEDNNIKKNNNNNYNEESMIKYI